MEDHCPDVHVRRQKMLEITIQTQSQLIDAQKSRISLLEAELRKRGKTRLLPKSPGLWMARSPVKKRGPGRPRKHEKDDVAALSEAMKAHQLAGGFSTLKAAIEDFYTVLAKPKTRTEKRAVLDKSASVYRLIGKRNSLK